MMPQGISPQGKITGALNEGSLFGTAQEKVLTTPQARTQATRTRVVPRSALMPFVSFCCDSIDRFD